jgi:hypothetical protein
MLSGTNANARVWAQTTVPATTAVGLKYLIPLQFVGASDISLAG